MAIVRDLPEGGMMVIAWVRTTADDTRPADDDLHVSLIEHAPELLAWLEKAAQLAKQQALGGEDVPSPTAWGWLEEHASSLIARVMGGLPPA